MTDSPVDLDELEALAKAATPGPWYVAGCTDEHTDSKNRVCYRVRASSFGGRDVEENRNRDYIAALNPAVALTLIAELRASRAVEPGVVTREHRDTAEQLLLTTSEAGAAAWTETGEPGWYRVNTAAVFAQAIADAEVRGASRTAPPADLHQAWEQGYAHGYDDREKMDHDRADVVRTENPYSIGAPPADLTTEVERLRSELFERDGCPCLRAGPCSTNCTCAHPVMSGGCRMCCRYGSEEQRAAGAAYLFERAGKAPPADEVAGLTWDLETLRDAISFSRSKLNGYTTLGLDLTYSLDRIEAFIKQAGRR